jgi:hypothetical protein
MDKKKPLILGIVLLIGLMLTGCAWYHNGSTSPYYNLGLGFGYYGYPYDHEYEGGQHLEFDVPHHHH